MASRGVNKVILVGNVGNDPEVRYMPNGNAVANISIATSEVWKDKENGEQQEKTEWHRVVFFNRLAEIVEQYIKKGSKLYIEGRLQTKSYEKDGQNHYSTEIVASEMQMLDTKSTQKQGESYNQGSPARAENKKNDYSAARDGDANNQSQPAPSNFDNFDDDIPF